MHKLIIEDDEGKAVVVPLIRDEITIGRQEGNTIRLTERNVSRRHARLIRREGRYLLEDLSSYTGSKVNGSRITSPVALNDGDQVLIGDYKLGIKVEKPATTMMGYPTALPGSGNNQPAPAAAPPTAPLGGNTIPATVAPAPAIPTAPPPPEPIEGAPTIPVRTLADQGLVPAVGESPSPSQPPARLVVMSQPFAGQEFVLDRASVVIGRTQENDIVLNHKSISRHHAKIIRDGDRYVVVDLESANGVRVNGAEYERVELQSGDVVELGHVRLRFATADDASVFDDGSFRLGGNRKRSLYVGGGVALVVVAAAIFALSGDKEEARTPSTELAAKATSQALPPPPTPSESAQALIAQAKESYRNQKWADALVSVTRAATISPGVSEADELRRAIEIEQQNAAKFEALQRASDTRDYAGVIAGASAIPDGSAYRQRAKGLEQEARVRLVAQHLANAEKRRSEGSCVEARREAEAVLAMDAENQSAQELIARCTRPSVASVSAPPKPVVAARPLPLSRPPAAPRPVSGRSPPLAAAPAARSEEAAPAPAAERVDADEMMQQAQDAWIKGQYAVAIEASRRALRVRPGLSRAYQIIAVCSCSLRDAESATRAYERLDDKNRQLVKSLCQKSGVTIE